MLHGHTNMASKHTKPPLSTSQPRNNKNITITKRVLRICLINPPVYDYPLYQGGLIFNFFDV